MGKNPVGRRRRKAALSFEPLEPRLALAANFVISEFLADNEGVLLDNYGVASDWVEIRNDGDAAGNLLDYYLTDNAAQKTKWRFPSVVVPAGGHVLVWASGQDDRDPGLPLHTNFALANEGEYLGLVAPDGETVVHDYGSQFPPQRNDVSYGLGTIVDEVHFVSPGATAQILVPTSPGYDAIWKAPDYAPDANWSAGTTGIGYGQTTTGFLVKTYQAIGQTLDTIDEALELVGNPAAYSSTAAANRATINFRNSYSGAGNATRYTAGQTEFPGQTTGTNYNYFVTEAHARITIPTAGNWTFGLDHNEGYLLRVGDQEFEQNGTGSTERFHTFTFATPGTYDLDLFHFESTGSAWLKLYAAPGTFTSFNSGAFDLVGDVASGGLAVTSDVVGSTGGSIKQLLGTDLQAQMLGFGSSFYARISFNAVEPAFDQLTLRMKYDDAFVAYLNGTEVARRNFVGTPAFNSISGPPRTGEEVLQYEDIDVTAFLGSLIAGQNVLAIHGINASAVDPDLLVLPELIATDAQSAGPAYFTTPTPGAANASGYVDFVAEPQASVERGFYTTAQQVALSTTTASAQIYYTTNGDVPTPAAGTLYTGPIAVSGTTVLRAAAFRSGYLPSDVVTQSYFFLNDVVRQTSAATLAAGFPSLWGTTTPDYGLDPDVIGNFDAAGNPIGGDLFGGVYAATIKNDLASLPTISLVIDVDDMFGPSGIYTNSTQRGSAWERAASFEWIDPGELEFQVNAGLRIQGGAFRSHGLTKKHSLRLLFKNEYGPGKLTHPIFGDDAGIAYEFNTIVLRAGANDGYTWSAARFTEQYTRDQFGRSLQGAAGHAAAHGTFAHLYINGIYWGLYNPVERPDNEFGASYVSGDPDNWDSIHVDETPSGDSVAWDAMFAKAAQAGGSLAAYMELQGKNPDGTPNPAIEPLLDLENYIDYIALNVWGGNWDWPFKNYWAGRDRDPATTTGFQFFSWDFENTMGNNRSRSPLEATTLDQNFTGARNAGQPHTSLQANAEYRLKFADHVHRLFFNDGILTPASLIARYASIAAEVERAIVAESARWGDTHHSAPLTLAEWYTERDWLLNTYLPQRSAIVMTELKNFNLYPSVDAPSFNQHGGQVPTGFDVTVTAPAGAIWYTTDGTDPRALGGAVSGTAIPYLGTPVDVAAGLTLKARVLSGGVWSALNEADFSVAVPADATNLRIVELNYHPVSHPGVVDEEDLEFIELLNPSQQLVSLDGVSITQFASTPYAFPSGLVLGPGERIVVARTPSVFQSFYGSNINLAPTGYATANLSNGGERIALVGPGGVTIEDFVYGDGAPWPTAADGGGRSLELVNPFRDPSNGANWRASYLIDGSPGTSGVKVGDFDGDQDVDGHDFLAWQRGLGTPAPTAASTDGDADLDYDVDADDLGLWAAQFGEAPAGVVAASAAANAAPPAEDDRTALLAADEWILLADAASAPSRARPAVRALLNDAAPNPGESRPTGLATPGPAGTLDHRGRLRLPATSSRAAARDAAFCQILGGETGLRALGAAAAGDIAISPKI